MNKRSVKNKDVIFLCQFFYPEKVSSATLPFDTAEYLASKGLKVGCLCGYPKEYIFNDQKVEKKENVNGVEINRLKYKTFSRKSKIGRIINYFSFTVKCMLNIKKLKDYEYLIVYSNPPVLPYVAYKANKKYKTKIIFVSYDVYPEIAINTNSISKRSIISKVMNHINKRLYANVYKVVTLSDDMKKFLIDNRNVDSKDIVTIHNWYDKDMFVKRVPKEEFVITYLGNLGICQDIETILKTALILNNEKKYKFIIGGHGNKIEYIKNFISQNNLKNVTLLPFLSGNEYDEKMIYSDCFIVSLEKGLNGLCFPSKYYSYLSYGRPILAISEISELTNEIESNNIGFCVRNGDSSELSNRIISLSNNNKIDDICEKARNIFNNLYNKEICVSKYYELINKKRL